MTHDVRGVLCLPVFTSMMLVERGGALAGYDKT